MNNISKYCTEKHPKVHISLTFEHTSRITMGFKLNVTISSDMTVN